MADQKKLENTISDLATLTPGEKAVVKSLLMQLGRQDLAELVNPKAKITIATVSMPESFGDMAKVRAVMDDGSEMPVFEYFSDELHFAPAEFIGLTLEQAHALKTRKDVAYLRS